MKTTSLIVLLLIGLGFGLWHLRGSLDSRPDLAEQATVPESINDTKQHASSLFAEEKEKASNLTSVGESSEGKSEEEAYYEQLNFRQHFSGQLNQFEHDSEVEKRKRKVALFAKISELEAATYFTADQGLVLKLAVLGKALTGQELETAAKQLKAAYQNQSEAILAAHAANSDPLWAEYKQREREIVKEVLALSEYPEGLSREQYLQQRLDAARREIYSQR